MAYRCGAFQLRDCARRLFGGVWLIRGFSAQRLLMAAQNAGPASSAHVAHLGLGHAKKLRTHFEAYRRSDEGYFGLHQGAPERRVPLGTLARSNAGAGQNSPRPSGKPIFGRLQRHSSSKYLKVFLRRRSLNPAQIWAFQIDGRLRSEFLTVR